MKAGTLSHSRWLKTANAFMRLYVNSHGLVDPAVLKTLKVITIFIVEVCYPCWIEIKVKHNWLNGPGYVLHQLQLLQLQVSATQGLLRPHIESSCWYAYFEMILQTMISSDDTEERRFAVEKIMEIRGNASQGSKAIRFRRHPGLNLKAATLRSQGAGTMLTSQSSHATSQRTSCSSFCRSRCKCRPSQCMASPLSVVSKK